MKFVRPSSARNFTPIAVGLAAATIAWVRLGSTARGTMWAEDGHLFIADAMHHGVFAWFRPYGGYFQLAPRLIASAVVSTTSVTHYAVAMTFCACLAAGACAAVVFHCSVDVVRDAGARWVLALLTALAPALPVEVLGNAANLHTLLLWSAIWVLLHRPRTRRSAYGWASWLALVTLSDVQVIFLVPLALWRWRDPFRRPVTITLLLGAALELTAGLTATRTEPRDSAPTLANALGGFLTQVCSRLGLVPTTGAQADTPWLSIGAATTVLLLIAAIAYAWRRGGPETHAAITTLTALAGLTWYAAVIINHAHTGIPDSGQEIKFQRYAVLPQICLIAVVLLAVSLIRATQVRRIATSLLAVGLISGAGLVGPSDTHRDQGPVWSTAVSHLQQTCASRPDSTLVEIPEAPARSSNNWSVEVRCSDLR